MGRFAESVGLTPRQTAKRAVRFVVGGHQRGVAGIAGTAFLAGLFEAAFLVTATRAAFALAHREDRVDIVSGWDLPVPLTLLLAVTLVGARLGFGAYATWLSARVSTRVVADIRKRLSQAFLDASWEVQQAQPSGSLQQLLTDHSAQASALMGSVIQAVVTGANLTALLGTAIAVDPAGAVLLVLSVSVLGLLLRPLRSAVRRRASRANEAGMTFARSVSELSELGLELHVFHVQAKAQALVSDAIERSRRANAGLGFIAGLATPVYTGLAYLAIVGALAIVAASNTSALTSMGAAMLVMLRSLSYGQALQGAYLAMSGATPAVEELQRHLQIFDTGRRIDGGQPVGPVGAISMEGVSFSYRPGQPVLRNISFAIQPREIIGVVGPSGAGKSTLVQLLLGLRDPDTGRVLAGGRDVATLDRTEWARKVTFVPQAAHLIAGTIAENIRFLRGDVSQRDVEQAACLAHVHDDILAFPEGYERQVGKLGGHLSGGQQQRLCIARALVERPDVLILDEPTSALDVRSEHLIRNTLLALKDRMTVIVIAHRLSTLTICDRIMVIKDGELKAFDSPPVLEQSSDFFREALALSGMR